MSVDLGTLTDVELRDQLVERVHELARRRHPAEPWVWYLPTQDPFMVAQLHRREGARAHVELLLNGVTIVTRLNDHERAALIAWLIAQDRPREAAPDTT